MKTDRPSDKKAIDVHKHGLSRSFPQDPTPFDLHFRTHVVPRLKAGAKRLAPFVARCDIEWSEAADTLASVALKLGAAGVSDLESLLAFLGDQLSAAIAECER